MIGRVVHGGERFTESVLVTPRVIADIEAVSAHSAASEIQPR